MFTCITPNGPNTYEGKGPCTRLLAGTQAGFVVLERENEDSEWVTTGATLDGEKIGASAYAAKQDVLAVSTIGNGVFFSNDKGKTWEHRSNGLPDEAKVWNIAYADKPTGLVFYAGVEPAAMYESSDLGRTWTEVKALLEVPGVDKWTYPPPPHIPHVNSLAVDPRDPEVMYVGIEQGAVLRTADGGASWTDLHGWASDDDGQYKDVHQVVLRASKPDEIYMTVGIGFYYSPDQGQTWERLTDETFRIGYPDKLVVSPDNDQHLLLTGAETNPITWFKLARANATIMRSYDGGRNWHQASNGLPAMEGNIEGLTIYSWEDGYTVFAANTEGRIYASDDFADSWTPVVDGLNPVTKSGHANLLAAAKAAKAA